MAYNFSELLNTVNGIRDRSENLCITPQTTEGNWLGINTASQQLFGEATFVIPQHFSNQVLTDEEAQQLVAHIEKLDFKNVIFSGFPPYFEKVIRTFSAAYAQRLGVILHGTFTEMGNSATASATMMTPIHLRKEKRIGKLGAVRRSVAEFISSKWQVPVFELANKCSIEGFATGAKYQMPGIHIGVFGADTFNKNLHNQVCGAALLQDVTVHVSKGNGYKYLNDTRIVEHPRLSRSEFVSLLSQMDVNLHLSFSESWGQLAAESMLTGVPCLVSTNTNLLDGDEFVKATLTVNRTDAPVEIAERIKNVLAQRNEVSEKGKQYVQQLNVKADNLLAEFLKA